MILRELRERFIELTGLHDTRDFTPAAGGRTLLVTGLHEIWSLRELWPAVSPARLLVARCGEWYV